MVMTTYKIQICIPIDDFKFGKHNDWTMEGWINSYDVVIDKFLTGDQGLAPIKIVRILVLMHQVK